MVDMTQGSTESGGGGGAWKRWLPLGIIAGGAALGTYLFGDYLSVEALRENREALLAWRDSNYIIACGTVDGQIREGLSG